MMILNDSTGTSASSVNISHVSKMLGVSRKVLYDAIGRLTFVDNDPESYL